MKSYAQLAAEARARVSQVTVEETMQLLREHPDTVLVDCREPNEFNLGRLPGALCIPRGVLEQNIENAVPRDRKIILYCASGNRSAMAALTLSEMGYQDVASLDTGFRGWVNAGGEVDF